MNQIKEVSLISRLSNDFSERQAATLDRELKLFLDKHALPMDRAELSALGYEVIIEMTQNPELINNVYTFKLARVIDRMKLVIKHKLEIV